MIPALDPFAQEWWAPDGQTPGEPETKFLVSGLNGTQQSIIAPGVDSKDGQLEFTYDAMRQTLEFGLHGWENFHNSAGPVAYSGNIHQDQVNMPLGVQRAVAMKIFDLTYLPKADKKK